MQLAVIQRILGILLSLFSLTMFPPLAISLFSSDGTTVPFISAFALILSIGLALWFPVRHVREELRLRDGFVVVVLFWVGLGITGCVPLILSDTPELSITDAIFESISGLTTTGATIITGIDSLPQSILFYRQELQWLGGMGIIVLAVAILPMLGIGGMQLYRAETPGPVKDTKLTPRITETAKALWYVYLGITIACALAYWLAGMSLFDAVAHSFSTVSIGGFSTHDASMGYFNNSSIEMVAILFMFFSGINFSLHFMAWRHTSVKPYWYDSELRTYLSILLIVCLLCVAYRLALNHPENNIHVIRDSIFQAVSIMTTTGFTTTDYQHWPGFLPMLLLFSSFIGACAGSTGGGIKVIRIMLLFKQGMREIKRLIHPSAIFIIKVGNKPIPERIVEAVWGFFAVYIAIFIFLLMALMAAGLDQVTAFSAIAACLNNLGPGLGDVSRHYGNINDFAKWILCFAMLLGRLEIFTLLVLFTPTFWRR
ncbi:MAG TPA: potassium transporter [Thiotrichaceae bacterium]|jgi:trk system potassium uptake protein TrkH|nr:potassium transporter [Thiotrichaceae bacterium]HIM07662.1 potassium transporter [Gammaproteobacteria bacterium]